MNKEFLASSIATASPVQLVVITYDIFFDALKEASECLKVKNFKGFDEKIDDAKVVLRQLMEALNMDYDISVDLMALYLQVQKLLISSRAGRKEEKLEQARKIMIPLYEGWTEISKNEEKNGIDDSKFGNNINRASVVAGMTYGKSDIDIMGNFGKEFKA